MIVVSVYDHSIIQIYHKSSYAHAGADLQAFLTFCFKPILLSAHKLIMLIYGDNTGQEKTSLSQRVSRAWKHIGEKIHNYCSHLSTLRNMLHSHIGPTCRGLNGQCIRTPWSIKGGRPLEEGGGAKTWQRIGSYTTKNNTPPSGRRVLRSGGPNHSKSCVLVCLSQS